VAGGVHKRRMPRTAWGPRVRTTRGPRINSAASG